MRDRVLSRSEFGLSVTGDRLRSTRFSLPPRPFTEIDGFATGRARFEIRVGQGEGQARLTREGVYPVEVRIFDADGVRIGGVVTHLVLLPDASEEPRPLAVALVSEIGLDPATAPDGSSITPPPETRDLARLIEVLGRSPRRPTVDRSAARDGRGIRHLRGPRRDRCAPRAPRRHSGTTGGRTPLCRRRRGRTHRGRLGRRTRSAAPPRRADPSG